MKVLALSDAVVSFVYSPVVRQRFTDVELVIGCGDLAYFYLEYVANALNVPLFFVRGNHDAIVEYHSENLQRTAPDGGEDLHRRAINHHGLLLAGVEGCLRYRPGPFQYDQSEMWRHVFSLAPSLLINRIRYGRFLDIFVTHAPPAGIHDQDDLPHQGIRAFRWFLGVFKPAYHFHGHVHVYRPDSEIVTRFAGTSVINCYEYCETDLRLNGEYTTGRKGLG